MSAEKLLYKGKAKSMYETADPRVLRVWFRDEASAFNGVRVEQLPGKGEINNKINAFVMQFLANEGIPTHFIGLDGPEHSLVRPLKMLPVECVIRNRAAGGIVKRLQMPLGTEFSTPIFEFFYKNDALGDPMVNESHIITFGWATAEQIVDMKLLTQRVNALLSKLLADKGMILVDLKLEFGLNDGMLTLGDEISPDGCRIWDSETKKILDKDRFRQELGEVVEHYREIAKRLGVPA
ncbi:MAG: phosphoribosylaminoimidazolesuccinocarboxamide synthase [Pseudomonadota bacterium]